MGSDPHSLMFLAISVAALLVGPGIHRLAEREPVTMAALDNFVLVAVVGLVALEILPGALQLAGLPALLALLLGALGPALADGPLHRAAAGTHRTALVLAVLGMAIHSFTDGLALASAHVAGGRSHALEVAVIAHQLPVAVAVWWLLSPAGLLRAAAAMLLLGLATVLGFLLADQSLAALAPAWLGYLQGLFAGLLLHVVAHRTHTADADLRSRVAGSLGGLAGLGLLALLVRDAGHAHDADPLARVLLAASELARASAPALLLGLLLLAALAARGPARGSGRGDTHGSTRGPTGGGSLRASLRGLALGVVHPVRAHDVLPVLRGLAARGTPASTSLAFLAAAPTLGVDALLLSMPLLGGGMTLARGLGAVVLALIVGRVAGGLADRSVGVGVDRVTGGLADRSAGVDRVTGGLADRSAGADLHTPADDRDVITASDPHLLSSTTTPRERMLEALDAALPWLALGLILAASLAPWLRPDTLTAIPVWLQIPLAAAIGVPAHLCAAGATPVIAVLLAAGLSPGAGLAFLLTGPAISVTSQALLGRLHGPRTARHNLVLFVAGAVVLGLALDYTAVISPGFTPAVHLHDVASEASEVAGDPGLASDLALAALIALALASLLRQTPQQFLRRLWVREDHGHSRGSPGSAIPADHTDPADSHHHGRWHTRRAHFSSRGPRGP